MKFSVKTVTVGSYLYQRPDWGVTVPVDVITRKEGGLGVRFAKGHESIIMANIPENAIFEGLEGK